MALFWVIIILFFVFLYFVQLNFATIKGGIGEKRVNKILQSLNPEMYKVLYDLYVPQEDGTTTQVDHVVTSPYGIFVIETKNYDGWIFGNEKSRYWTQVIYKRKEKIYNPIWQNAGHIKALQNYLNVDKHLFGSIIAFSNQSTFKFKEEFKRAKVIHFRSLLHTIYLQNSTLLDGEQLQEINQKLEQLIITDKKEKKKVSRAHVQRVRKRVSSGKVTPIDRKKCPQCESELVVKSGKYGSFLGCSNFPKCRYTRKMKKETS